MYVICIFKQLHYINNIKKNINILDINKFQADYITFNII